MCQIYFSINEIVEISNYNYAVFLIVFILVYNYGLCTIDYPCAIHDVTHECLVSSSKNSK